MVGANLLYGPIGQLWMFFLLPFVLFPPFGKLIHIQPPREGNASKHGDFRANALHIQYKYEGI